MTRLQGWAPRGEWLVESVPRNRGMVTTMLGAIRLDGMTALMTTEGATTGDVFQTFVEYALVPTLRPGDVVVMDNLGAHKTVAVRTAIEAVGGRVMFLPPYHPDLNPIEPAWGVIKDHVRSVTPRDISSLDQAIAAGMDLVTPRHASGWFSYCGYQSN